MEIWMGSTQNSNHLGKYLRSFAYFFNRFNTELIFKTNIISYCEIHIWGRMTTIAQRPGGGGEIHVHHCKIPKLLMKWYNYLKIDYWLM